MSDINVIVSCTKCSFEETISERVGGQSLFGTAGNRLARHEAQQGCTNNRKSRILNVEMTPRGEPADD